MSREIVGREINHENKSLVLTVGSNVMELMEAHPLYHDILNEKFDDKNYNLLLDFDNHGNILSCRYKKVRDNKQISLIILGVVFTLVIALFIQNLLNSNSSFILS